MRDEVVNVLLTWVMREVQSLPNFIISISIHPRCLFTTFISIRAHAILCLPHFRSSRLVLKHHSLSLFSGIPLFMTGIAVVTGNSIAVHC